jgi:putative DNA primase/helicase
MNVKKIVSISKNSMIAKHANCIKALHPDKNKRYEWTDIGNGNLFADFFIDYARYVPERKKWFVYDGKVWKPDIESLKVMQMCKDLADALMCYALSIQDEKARQDYMRFVNGWQKRRYRETILKDAASVYPVECSCFDADPMLFNCLNGTLNLETRKLRRHDPKDMFSKISRVVYNPQACNHRWQRFIHEIMSGDKEKAAFLQKSLGYALTGDNRMECLFLLFGPTSRNGKSTVMETFLKLVGDYGKTARPETIAQKHNCNSQSPSEDLARLAGARFVNIPEPDKNLTLSSALVKTLTGNDSITARFLYEGSIEFRPNFKIFINTNHLPSVSDMTVFTSDRIKVIPFERHFKENERDEGLKAQFAKPESLSGILNWCVTGLDLIQKEGFKTPNVIKDATAEYRKNNDKIGRFLFDEMEANSSAEIRTSLWEAPLLGTLPRWKKPGFIFKVLF